MEEGQPMKHILYQKPMGNKAREWPRSRFKDQTEEDLRKVNIRNWKAEHAIEKNGVDSWSRPRPTKGCRAIADDDDKREPKNLMNGGGSVFPAKKSKVLPTTRLFLQIYVVTFMYIFYERVLEHLWRSHVHAHFRVYNYKDNACANLTCTITNLHNSYKRSLN